METNLAVAQPKPGSDSLLIREDFLSEVTKSRDLLIRFVKAQMKEGTDYGIVPGTNKPSLLKPGAEKLAQLFGLRARIAKVDKQVDLKGNFASYDYTLEMFHLKTGESWGQCEGCCNSQEKKFKSRPAADMLNTLMKMAQKRAYVGAVIQATSASEIFTQDVEDGGIIEGEYMEANGNGHNHEEIKATENPGDHVIPFGKFKGKKISEIKPEALQNWMAWLMQEAQKKQQPLVGPAKHAVANGEKYLTHKMDVESKAAEEVDKL